MRQLSNPVLPGFYPDPSWCRVGEDFYLVNSTFACFPGVPIHHSRDLVHWQQIGNVLDRPSQLDLDGVGHSEGIFAPTIRHDGKRFYMITTNISKGGSFIVTAGDPAGPWSDPVWLRDAPGIDPSLFFDEDGRIWYCGTRPAPEGERYSGNWEVWLQELDATTLQLKGPVTALWRGALRDCIWPEGPHLYRRNGWYYLLIAEGGTGLQHAITIARSRELAGPWVGNPNNPILSHRDLGARAAIINTGHGDLLETPDGSWWMVLLASRPYGGGFTNLGRETFIVPVEWEHDWPLASPGTGRVEAHYQVPLLKSLPAKPQARCEHFDDSQLPPAWLYLRTPRETFHSLTSRPGWLRLQLRPPTLRDKAQTSFAGLRQRHLSFLASTKVDFHPVRLTEAAGLALVQSNDYQYRLELGMEAANPVVRLVQAAGGADLVIVQKTCQSGPLTLAVRADGQNLSFWYGNSAATLQLLAENQDARILSPQQAGGFVGTLIGLYATSSGATSTNHADFDWFEYAPIEGTDPAKDSQQ